MKTKQILIFITIVLIAAILNSCEKPEPVGHISGTVTDENGIAIEGAKITIAALSKETQTNSTGSFEFREVAVSNSYTIKAQKVGYKENSAKTNVADNQTAKVTIELITIIEKPEVSTGNATNITAITANTKGIISNVGSSPITAHGHCWSTSPDPISSLSTKTDKGNTSSVGEYTSSLTNLQSDTKYYVRAYATNLHGTSYSNEISFTTEIGTAIITISDPTNIDFQTLTANGNITDLGEANPTQHGFVWSIDNSNPTTTSNDGIKELGNTTTSGSFLSNLTNFIAAKDYYIRAFVTNQYGTTYSDVITFKTKNSFDYGGQSYNVVQIGNQIWMAENLNYETANSYWYDNSQTNGDIYGRLYTWNAANSACPSGWHLPSDAEWTTLINQLGGESVAGGKMKETGTSHWDSPNTGATNESGFNALPGGYRDDYDNGFYLLANIGRWWCSTESNTSNAWGYYTSNDNIKIVSEINTKSNAFSIRCIKDN